MTARHHRKCDRAEDRTVPWQLSGGPEKCVARMVTKTSSVVFMVKILDEAVVKIGVGDRVSGEDPSLARS